jgi:hypothetical protein
MTQKRGVTATFKELVDSGLPKCTADYLVAQYAHRFPPELVLLVESRLAEHGIEI